MKKLIIAAAIAMLGIAANASAVSWSCQEMLINGDAGEWTGTFSSSGWKVYLFDSSVTSYDTMVTALAAASTDMTQLNTALATASGTGTTGASGSFAVNGTTTVTGTYKSYAVILDAATIESANWAFLVEENTVTVGSIATQVPFSNTEGGWDAGYIGATGYGSAGNGWYAVPEPTSGLLMLLGMAGLALKRKRA